MGIYVVTGAASGIGQAVSGALRAEGHEVISMDLRDADINADLADSDACAAAAVQVLERAPDGLDGLVPCAGVGPEVPDRGLIPRVNFFAVVDLVNRLQPALEKRRGAVVLISSNSAQMTEYDETYMQSLIAGDRELALQRVQELEGQGAYGGSKQAIVRWMRRNTPALAAVGVRINAVAPGYTETGMTAAGRDHPEYGPAIREFLASVPLGRAGLPEDQANAVLFLLSERASFITGSVLFVDGGHDAVFRPDRF